MIWCTKTFAIHRLIGTIWDLALSFIEVKLSLPWDLQLYPVLEEEDVHDQHPTELQRGRGSYDSLKQSSEGSLQRVPSSSSQRSQSSEPSEHGNLSKELLPVF